MSFPTFALDREDHETVASAAAFTFTYSTYAAGDLMVLWAGCVRSGTGAATETVTVAPVGFTENGNQIQAGDGTHRSISVYCYYRVMTGGDGTTNTITWVSSGIRVVHNMVFSAGTINATQLVTTDAKTSGLSGGATQQSWTPANDAMGLEFVLSWGNDVYTTPANYTNLQSSANTNISFRADRETTGTSAGGNEAAVSVGTPASTFAVYRTGVRGLTDGGGGFVPRLLLQGVG